MLLILYFDLCTKFNHREHSPFGEGKHVCLTFPQASRQSHTSTSWQRKKVVKKLPSSATWTIPKIDTVSSEVTEKLGYESV